MKQSDFIKNTAIGGAVAMIPGFFGFFSLGMGWKAALSLTVVLDVFFSVLYWLIVFRWLRRGR